MSRKCDICGKGLQGGNRVSHAHNISKRVWLPNLKTVRAVVNGRVQQVKACTRCIRSEKVQKYAGRQKATA